MRNSTSWIASVNGANVVHPDDIFVVCESFINPVYADNELLLVGNIRVLVGHYSEEAFTDNASTDLSDNGQCRDLQTLVLDVTGCVLIRFAMHSIHLVKCQKQVGDEDCGLFAIAFATSIANGEDPSMREYCQGMMCMHLSKCFLNKHLELVP